MKKILLSFLAGLIVFVSFIPNLLSPIHGASTNGSTWYNSSFNDWYGKVYDTSNPNEIFGERYTAAQVQWVIYGLFGFLINTVTGPQNAGLIQCFLINTKDIKPCMDQLSKLVATTNVQDQMMATTNISPRQNLWSLVFATDRPISGISYVKERLEKLSPVSVVHAQSVGTGFNVLQPVQEFWKAFRNIAFGLFVIVAIVFAFMIMFRVKISPQTVISVQSALPKIIISLILVTFSYAIAGLLIDLMYIVIGLVSLVGSQMIPGLPPVGWFNFLTLGQPLGLNIQIGAIGILVIYIVTFAICLIILMAINVGAIGTLLTVGVVTALIASGVGNILLILVIILAIIALIIALWICIKVMWGLIKAFVNILLLTILAPVQLTLGAFIPNLGFGSWFKSYISNLAVFVVTGVLILFSFIFLAQGVQIGFASYGIGNSIAKVLLGSGSILAQATSGNINSWPPLLGGGGGAGVGLLFVVASFVLFTMIPKANDMIQAFLSGKPFAYGTAIGEAVGPFGGLAKGAGGIATGVGAGAGAIWIGGKLAGNKNAWVQGIGNAVTDYGNKSLGRITNKRGATTTTEPGDRPE